jgi:small subunit ribosomal protein S3
MSLFTLSEANVGQKVHPTGFRTGIIFDWKSRWFDKKEYKTYLKEDAKIRDFLAPKLNKMGLGKIEIERSTNSTKIILHTSRPGLIIGRGGTGIEQLREELQKHVYRGRVKKELRLEVEEIKQPESNAQVVAQSMAEQLERRLPYRRVIKQTLQRIAQSKNVEGAKIMIKGRLGGSEIARKEWLAKGRIPLQTLRANIDYGTATAYTTYGTVGIKVWIYKGEIF